MKALLALLAAFSRAAETLRRRFDMAGVEAALARLETTSYDSAAAQMKVAEATAALSPDMENVPRWYRTEMARFAVYDPEVIADHVIARLDAKKSRLPN